MYSSEQEKGVPQTRTKTNEEVMAGRVLIFLRGYDKAGSERTRKMQINQPLLLELTAAAGRKQHCWHGDDKGGLLFSIADVTHYYKVTGFEHRK